MRSYFRVFNYVSRMFARNVSNEGERYCEIEISGPDSAEKHIRLPTGTTER